MEDFRTCSITGGKIYLPAQKLIKYNAVTAFVFLTVGGLMAFLVGMTKWPVVHLLPADFFYRALTLHGIAMLFVWIVFFEVAFFYYFSAVRLNCRLAGVKWAWIAYVMMLGGAAIAAVNIIIGNADVMFTSYPPLQAHSTFYLGIIFFDIGALITCVIFFGTLAVAKAEKTYEGSLPLVVFGSAMTVIMAVFTFGSGAIIYVPTYLWSLGVIEHIDFPSYRLLFWAFAHSTQQINVGAHTVAWYFLAAMTLGAVAPSEKLCRTAFLFYALFIDVAGQHHLLTDPGFSVTMKLWNSQYILYMAVFAGLVHGFAIPASCEIALRKRGYTDGLFDWLKKAPWHNPAFGCLGWSIFGFGFLGGISGVVLGIEQISLISHNTWRIVGHFHGTVVMGTAMSFMGIAYVWLPQIFQKEIAFPTVAKFQPHVYGASLSVLSLMFLFAGAFGHPRRHWDVTMADAAFQAPFEPFSMMLTNIFGLAVIGCVIGGAMFLIVMFGTALTGKPLESGSKSIITSPKFA